MVSFFLVNIRGKCYVYVYMPTGEINYLLASYVNGMLNSEKLQSNN